MEFDKYVDVYTRIWDRVNDKDVALAILAETAKDTRIAQMTGKQPAERKASLRQLDLLEKLGVKADTGISSAEASRLIDRAKARPR